MVCTWYSQSIPANINMKRSKRLLNHKICVMYTYVAVIVITWFKHNSWKKTLIAALPSTRYNKNVQWSFFSDLLEINDRCRKERWKLIRYMKWPFPSNVQIDNRTNSERMLNAHLNNHLNKHLLEQTRLLYFSDQL